MSEKKVQKVYIDNGFGFPVRLLNAPLLKTEWGWVLDLNPKKLEKEVLLALASKKARLTGNQVRFVRHHFEMDLKSFGKRFGDVAHSAVIKWEKCGDGPTSMNWSTEKDIRLAIMDKIFPKQLRDLYSGLEDVAPAKPLHIKIDLSAA